MFYQHGKDRSEGHRPLDGRPCSPPTVPLLNPAGTFGVPFASGHLGDTPATLRLSYASEGLLLVANCSCGARKERLIDVSGVQDQVEAQLRCLSALAPAGKPIGQWALGHAGCTHSPKRHPKSELLTAIQQMAEQLGRGWLASGEPVFSHTMVFMSDGQVVGGTLDQIPGVEDLPARRHAVAALHEQIRRETRAADGDPLAALTMTEVWSSTQREVQPTYAADRVEQLLIAITTPEWGEIGLGRIVRASGRCEEGSGTVGQLAWHPLTGASPLIDGLLAETIAPTE